MAQPQTHGKELSRRAHNLTRSCALLESRTNA